MKTRDPLKCDKEVFEHGEFVGVFACSKEEAEKMCEALTNETNIFHDWYFFFGGRVVLMREAK